jgi:hypothetical protein
LYVAPGGAVGFGTSTPRSELSIYKPGGQNAIEFSADVGPAQAGSVWTVGMATGDQHKFVFSTSTSGGVGADRAFVITRNGEVSINKASPDATYNLDVYGNTLIEGDLDVTAGLNLTALANVTGSLLFVSDAAGVMSNTGGIFTGDGTLIGVGTSTPYWKLTIAGDASTYAGTAVVTLGDCPAEGVCTSYWSMFNEGGNFYFATSSPTNYATSSVPTLAIIGTGAFNSGAVAIGTSTPYAKLTVWGDATSTQPSKRIFEVVDSASTTVFSVDTSGTTTIDYLTTGAMSFEANSGMISWIDMPVSTTTANLAMGYTAGVDSMEMLTLFASTTGTGGTDAYKVIIGTTSPAVLGKNSGSTTPLIVTNGAICAGQGTDGADNGCGSAAYIMTAGTVYSIATAMTQIDVAENYPTTDTDIEAGDVLMLDAENPVYVTKYDVASANKPVLVGVMSTAPGVLLGGFNNRMYGAIHRVPVALAGRVPVKVNLDGGDIAIGDYITVSSVSGVGMKATTSGQIVGIALEPFGGTTQGENGEIVYEKEAKITVFVNLGWQKIDSEVAKGTVGTNEIWTVDSTTGAMKMVSAAALNLRGKEISNVRSILSESGKWSVSEEGVLVVDSLEVRGNVRIGSPERRAGITLYDENTGEPYCIKIIAGVVTSTGGQCGEPIGSSVQTSEQNNTNGSSSETSPGPGSSSESTQNLPSSDNSSSTTNVSEESGAAVPSSEESAQGSTNTNGGDTAPTNTSSENVSGSSSAETNTSTDTQAPVNNSGDVSTVTTENTSAPADGVTSSPEAVAPVITE